MIASNSSLCNSPKLEATKMSLSRWTGKQTVVHLHQELRLSPQKEETTDSGNNVDGLKGITLSEKGQRQHDSIYITFLKL